MRKLISLLLVTLQFLLGSQVNPGLAAKNKSAIQEKAISNFSKYPTKKLNSAGLQFHFGPNLDKSFKKFLVKNANSTLAIWADFYDDQEKFQVFAGSEKDMDWIIKEWQPYGFDTSFTIADYQGRIAAQGKEVNAGTVPSLQKKSHLTVIRGSALASRKNFAIAFIPHETTHIVQQYITNSNTDKLPCWAREGGADFFGAVASTRINKSSYEAWKKQEMYMYKYGNSGLDIKSFNATQWLEQLNSLDGNFAGGCDFAKKFAYGPGILISELQVAQKGVPAIVEWWGSLKNGEDWKVSFQRIYGKEVTEWFKSDAIPYIISEYKRL